MASVGIEVADSIRLTGTAAGALGIQVCRRRSTSQSEA